MSNRNAIFQRVCLAAVLAAGLGTVLGIAVGWGWSIIETFRQRPYISEFVQVLDDGTPIIRRSANRSANKNSMYRTLEGKETAAPSEEAILLAAHLPAPLRSTIFDAGPRGSDRLDGFSDLCTPSGSWYFVHNGKIDGSGYFVGFDGRSKLCIGYLGRAGFRLDLPPAEEWFPVDGRKMGHERYDSGKVFSRALSFLPNGYLFDLEGNYARPRDIVLEPDEGIPSWQVAMISDNRVWLVDFREQTATVLMESPELVSIGTFHPAEPAGRVCGSGTGPAAPERPDAQMPKLFAVRTREQILILNAGGKQLRSYTIPAELRDKGCAFHELSNTSALLDWDRNLPDDSSRKELWWIDNAGKVAREKELALMPGAKPRDETVEMWVFACVVPVPIVWTTVAYIIVPLELLVNGRVPSYLIALGRALPDIWLPMLAVFIVSAAMAWLCFRRQKRYALGGTWAWVAFVFLAGVPGMLAYLFHRRWPVLEKCPACTHVVPHDRDACCQCGSEFPAPQAKGIEVFA